MESTGNIVPYSGQTTPSPSDLHVLLVHQGGIVVSMFAKKLYVCLHKVAMAPSNMVDQVLRILREKVCLCEGIICEEEASSAAPADNALLQTIMNLASELDINFKVISQDHSLARIWSGTSDACVYTSRGDMIYAVQMRRRANQMMEHQRISSSSVAIGSSQVAGANNNNNNNNEITAASDTEGVRRNYSSSDQQLAEATVSDSSSPPTKKQRCVWTPQLHGAFEEAFNDLASSMPPRAAVPKKILECMKKRKKNIPDWISRENIASHLQKYRKSIAKQQSQPTMQQGGLLTDIPTSSRSISKPTKTGVAPVLMPSCRSDPAICNMAQLNISGLDHSALGAGYNLTRSSTMDLKNEDPYQMSQGLSRDPSASGLGEVDYWSNDFLMSQLNGYGHQQCSDEVLRSLVNRFEHHCPNHDSMFGRPAVGSIQHGLSFITNDQHNGGTGLGQQLCPNPGEVGLFNQRSSFIANDQHNNGGTGFRQQCPNSDSVGLVNQYGSSFIANDQTYNAVYVPVGNAGFDFGQQQPNQNYNSEVQSNSSALPQLGGSTIIQNYKAEVHSNSFLPNVAQQGGSPIIQNYNPEVQINSVPPNVAQQGGSTRFINTVPAKHT